MYRNTDNGKYLELTLPIRALTNLVINALHCKCPLVQQNKNYSCAIPNKTWPPFIALYEKAPKI